MNPYVQNVILCVTVSGCEGAVVIVSPVRSIVVPAKLLELEDG